MFCFDREKVPDHCKPIVSSITSMEEQEPNNSDNMMENDIQMESVEDVPKVEESSGGEVFPDSDLSDGFNMMQPHWEQFRKNIELKAADLKKQNEKEMEMKQKQIDALNQQLGISKKEHENKIAHMKQEHEKNIRDMEEKHVTHLESLKTRVRSTLNEAGQDAMATQLVGMTGDTGQSGIGKMI